MCMKKAIRRAAGIRRKMRTGFVKQGSMCPSGCLAYQHEIAPGVFVCPVCGKTTHMQVKRLA